MLEKQHSRREGECPSAGFNPSATADGPPSVTLINTAKCGKLTVGDQWTANVTHNSPLVARPAGRLKFDALPLKAVVSYNEAAPTVLNITFRITDFQHFVERDYWFMWWLHLLELAKQELRGMEAVVGGPGGCRKFVASFSHHEPDGDGSRGMWTMRSMHATTAAAATNNPKSICTGLVMCRPSSALLWGKAWCTPVGWPCEAASGTKSSPITGLESIMLRIRKAAEWCSSRPRSTGSRHVISTARTERYVGVVEKSFTAKLRRKLLNFMIRGFPILLLVWG